MSNECQGDQPAGRGLSGYGFVINCPHSIDKDRIILEFDPKQPGHNALNQLSLRSQEASTSRSKKQIEAIMRLVQEFGDAMVVRGRLAALSAPDAEYRSAFDETRRLKVAVESALTTPHNRAL